MIRITIEVDGTEVSSTIVRPKDSLDGPPSERLARAAALGATDAGSAPSELASISAASGSPSAIDAGAARDQAK